MNSKPTVKQGCNHMRDQLLYSSVSILNVFMPGCLMRTDWDKEGNIIKEECWSNWTYCEILQ